MIATSWHLGAAKFLMMLLFGITRPMGGSSVTIPTSPRRSTLRWMVELSLMHPACVGPGQWTLSPICVPPSFGEFEHWQNSCTAFHPMLREPHLDPGMQQAFDLQLQWSHDLHRIRNDYRAEITVEIQQVVDAADDDTYCLWSSLPDHVAAVYYNKEFDQITQAAGAGWLPRSAVAPFPRRFSDESIDNRHFPDYNTTRLMSVGRQCWMSYKKNSGWAGWRDHSAVQLGGHDQPLPCPTPS